MHRITAHLRRDTVGYLVLFLALSGTSYAATAQTGPPAGGGSGTIGARARNTSSVAAKHGAWTDVPLKAGSWTQSAGELELLAGTMVVTTPAICTGGFGNALTLSVDGQAISFAPAVAAPGSGATTLTIPFAVGTLSEPDRDTPHTLTAKFGNSCTKDGEDFTIQDVQVDVLKFR